VARIIIGFMGSGKSTISSLLDKDYIDMDALITERIGMSIADFFEKEGEAKFREIESQVLAELANSDHVISTGGGVVINPINREILAKNPETIYLKADFDTRKEAILFPQNVSVLPQFEKQQDIPDKVLLATVEQQRLLEVLRNAQ
jgi:shikimate kinase